MERAVPFLADTSGAFKQLLAAEQTAQLVEGWIQEKKDTIRSIKKQAIDQDIPCETIYGHIKQLEEDIGAFKRLLVSNETSRNHWRELHVSAWRATVRPLKVVDMPNELLTKIFANFEDVPVPQIQIDSAPFDDSLTSPDLASIKSIRLTCRAFCEVASEILLPLVTVSFSRSSLRRLEEISNHPTISKGVRLIRFNISPYSSWLTNPLSFFDAAATRLANLHTMFGSHAGKTHCEMTETLRTSGFPAGTRSWAISGLDAAQEMAAAISKAIQTVILPEGFESVVPLDPFETRIRIAISRAHEEYVKRYSEQQNLFKDHDFHAKIVSSIRRIPSIKRISITDLHGRHWHRIFKTGWNKRLDVQKYSATMMGSNPLHDLMVQPGAYESATLAEDGEPPLSLLHHLPSMFQDVNQKLTHLAIDISPDPKVHTNISTEDLQNLRQACQQLKSVKLSITKAYPHFRTSDMSPACFSMIGTLVGAITGSPYLEELGLTLMPGRKYRLSDAPTILGHVLENLSGNKVRSVWLSHVPIKIHELQQLLERVPRGLHLEMDSTSLLDGTWAQVLDMLRGSTDSTSRIVYPRGGEKRTMSEREARYFRHEFRSEHRDGWYSDQRCPGPASFYIRGGNIPNPLIWGSD